MTEWSLRLLLKRTFETSGKSHGFLLFAPALSISSFSLPFLLQTGLDEIRHPFLFIDSASLRICREWRGGVRDTGGIS